MQKRKVVYLIGCFLIAIVAIISLSRVIAAPPPSTQGHPLSEIDFSDGFANANLNMNSHKITNVVNPTANSDAATKGWVEAEVGDPGVKWAGYTGTTDGHLFTGYSKGANAKCYDLYSGDSDNVHWCSINEILELGNNYNWQYAIWVRDALRGVGNHNWTQVTNYGGAGGAWMLLGPHDATCDSWSNNAAINFGPVLDTDGKVKAKVCNSNYRIGCCYY